jgi:hypothetical protein
MRLALIAALAAALAASHAEAHRIIVVDPNEGDIRTVQQGMLAASPGDTVVLSPGVYDSVYTFVTSVGTRTAICRLVSGVTLRGVDRADCVIDHTGAEYGILCENVGADTSVIRNLTVKGGIGRDAGRGDDGDGRGLVAGIACLENASPTIENVTIKESATGVVARGGCAPTIRGTVIALGSHHGIYVYMNGTSPVVIDHVTAVQNFDVGVYVFSGSATIANSAITHNGKPGVKSYECTPPVSYSNVYMNGRTSPSPANYEGGIDDQTGLNGNISQEPYYCDYVGAIGYDYHVCLASPNVGAGQGGTDIGALGGACSQCVSPVNHTSWGAIKALYR